MNHSPDRNNTELERYLRICKKQNKEPDSNYLAVFKHFNDQKQQREAEEQFQKNNLEYDLRTCDWICEKAKARESYAQNIYAALCNQNWQRHEVWPLLQNQTWSCSWRYAGGIVADMCEKGDYLDWYCSGIRDIDQPDRGYVSEGVVTDEIKQDFFRLGWIPVGNEHD